MITIRNVGRITGGLDGDDGAGDGIFLRYRLLKKKLQGFPGAATQIGKKIPVIEKIPAQDFRDAEDDVSVGNFPEHVRTEPFPEFHHPLLMAGRTEMRMADLRYLFPSAYPYSSARRQTHASLRGSRKLMRCQRKTSGQSQMLFYLLQHLRGMA
jgi:hypothetical protein